MACGRDGGAGGFGGVRGEGECGGERRRHRRRRRRCWRLSDTLIVRAQGGNELWG